MVADFDQPGFRGTNMAVNWSRDIDQALAAKDQIRPILLDFSAAPA